MNQYRKKPIIVEAFQMTKERRHDNSEWPEWLHKAWVSKPHETGSVWPEDFPHSSGTDRLMIGTLEGSHRVDWDDYIIQGVKGELYPCKPDVFDVTYEAVIHRSDCAVHNGPAYKPGPCDCGA
ncbi:hypothetical protein [Salidesulfovibrio brasiliensis]|uniref:hypothetical protein n=1 Tax=Salidesulfovibrio brasiliensis TaxID=221711 RepID=UPI0006D25BD9|nr:hypothetical protein [Salidesulfovibrio brasiliensis]